MKKQELIKILERRAIAAYRIARSVEGKNKQLSHDLKQESFTLRSVINMLEDKRCYDSQKEVWLDKKESKQNEKTRA